MRNLVGNLRVIISKLDFEILSYNFDIDNDVFLAGIRKIAFNFALDKKIDFSYLKHGIKVKMEAGKLADVPYDYPTIPFVPLNPMNQYMEMEANFSLYHNLILFSQEQHLWCYVELFGTFQYYVFLSNQWDKSNIVLESYLQLIQKIDRAPPQMKRWRPKYGLIYSDVYDVPSSPDREVMRERVAEAVRLEQYEKTMSKLVSPKMDSKYLLNYECTDLSENEKRKYALSLLLYFDEEDYLIENRYRQVTLGEQEWEMVSYPLKLMLLRNQGKLNENEYQEKKLSRLNEFLIVKD